MEAPRDEDMKVEVSQAGSVSLLRDAIAQFAYAPTSPAPQRPATSMISSRLQAFKLDVPSNSLIPSTPSPSPKRKLKVQAIEEASDIKSKKQKRGYAAPEVYAHLNGLQDRIAENLDGELFFPRIQ